MGRKVDRQWIVENGCRADIPFGCSVASGLLSSQEEHSFASEDLTVRSTDWKAETDYAYALTTGPLILITQNSIREIAYAPLLFMLFTVARLTAGQSPDPAYIAALRQTLYRSVTVEQQSWCMVGRRLCRCFLPGVPTCRRIHAAKASL